MPLPYLGEIRMFAGRQAPEGWAFCDGALLPVAQNEALFELIGTTYGGDGKKTFQLPDLRGRLPLNVGDGFFLGEFQGSESVTVNVSQMASHSHLLEASATAARHETPQGNVTGQTEGKFYGNGSPFGEMNVQAIAPAGGGKAHPNVQPFLCINFIIALAGLFPKQEEESSNG